MASRWTGKGPSPKTRAATLVQSRARNAIQDAFKVLANTAMKGMMDFIIDANGDGPFKKPESAVVQAAVNAGLEQVQERVEQDFRDRYPRTIVNLMLGVPLRTDNQSLSRQYLTAQRLWNYRKRRNLQMNQRWQEGRAKGREPTFRTQRQYMSEKYGYRAKTVRFGNRTFRYDTPYGGRFKPYGVETGVTVADLGQRINARVELINNMGKEQTKFQEHVSETVNFNRFNDGPIYDLSHARGAVRSGLRPMMEGVDLKLRATRTLDAPEDRLSQVMQARGMRYGSTYPFNRNRLATEVLAESINQVTK